MNTEVELIPHQSSSKNLNMKQLSNNQPNEPTAYRTAFHGNPHHVFALTPAVSITAAADGATDV